MAFVVGSVLIGGASSLIGAGIASKGSKDAAKTAAAGSDRAIDFQKESRDIALDLGSPYREAGYSALDKLGSMTGLLDSGGSFGRPSYQGEGAAVTGQGTPWGDSPWKLGYDNGQYTATLNDQKMFWDDSQNQWMSSTGSAYGGSNSGKRPRPVWQQQGDAGDWVQGRAHGGVMYNVNELGPENVYSGGAITRSSNPKTMPPDPRGYVHPNIQGRAIGGTMVDPNAMGDGKPGPGVLATNPDQGGGLYNNINPGRQYGDPNYQGNPLHTPNYTREVGGSETPMYHDAASGNSYAVGTLPPKENWGSSTGVLAQDGKYYYGNNAAQDAANIGGGVVGGPANTGGNTGGQTGGAVDENGYPIPQENPYDFTTDPGYQFRLNEGMRALEASAAARGGLLSGGFGRKAIRYGQDYASNEFSNIYNRISNIAGLGQVSAGQGGVFAQNAGGQMGNAAQSGALSSAYGQMGSTNAWSNAFNQIAQLPWDKVFK